MKQVLRPLCAGLVLAIVAMSLALLPAQRAEAAPAAVVPPAGAVPHVTRDPLPTTQINGIAWSQTTVGNTVYVVGNFSAARPAGSPAGTNETPRANILAYDIRTGVLDTGFVHSLNGQARVVTASPDGSTLYVGGDFTTVDGKPRARIAAFSVPTGELLPFAPVVTNAVYAIAATNSVVYLGGYFTSVNGAVRTRLAAVTSAGALTAWAPSANQNVRGIVLSPDGSRVYLGGSFNAVNGVANSGLAAVSASTGAVQSFPAGQQIRASDGTEGTGVYNLSTDGKQVYLVSIKATENFRGFEGSASFDAATGSVVWVNNCYGDSYSTFPMNGVVYVASHAHDCSSMGEFGESAHKFGLAYSTAPSGRQNSPDSRGWGYTEFSSATMQQWAPTFVNGTVTGQSVWSFTGTSDYIAVGGEFPRVNTSAQQGLVRFAMHPAAPNAFGPYDIGTLTVAGSSTNSAAVATVTLAQPAYDPDDDYLVYELYRDGDRRTPVDRVVRATAPFWNTADRGPAITLTDSGAAPGTRHTYEVEAQDPSGRFVRTATASVTLPLVNLAVGRPASQSSTYEVAAASRAVDGTTDGNWRAGSVTHTLGSGSSWWQTDLQDVRALGSMTVWNRTDAEPQRLRDYWVFVSSSPFDTALTPVEQSRVAGVWSTHQTSAPAPSTTVQLPAGTTGRYVMVQTGTPNTPLSLAEVQVFTPPGGFLAADQTSVDFGTVEVGSTTSRTVLVSNPGSTPVTLRTVTPPTAPFRATGLPAAGTLLAPGASVPVSVVYAPTSPDLDSGTVVLEAGQAGSVTVTLAGQTRGALSNLSQGRPASQSSTFETRFAASNAVDGNTGTMNHTGADANAWWQVDLGSVSRTSQITLSNRTDCCADRLADYWVFVSSTPFDTTLTPAQQAAVPGVWSTHRTVAPAPTTTIVTPSATSGRYVMVQQGTSRQYLHMTEVTVQGSRPGAVEISTSAVSFGTVAVGQSASRPVTLTNVGATPVTLTSVTGVGGPFSVSPELRTGAVVPASSTLTGTVTYAPTAIGLHTASLGLTTDDGRGTRTVSLSGETPDGVVDLSQGRPVTQSTTLDSRFPASNAVDGRTDTFTHTDFGDASPWWQVDLGVVSQVSRVVVTNRLNCCGDRLRDYWVFVSATPLDPSLTSAALAAQPGVWASRQTTQPSPSTTVAAAAGTTGRYVTVRQNTPGQVLSLGEVQVMGLVPPTNRAPTAAFTTSCTAGACLFDAGASADPDGPIAVHRWDFGDGTTGAGVQVSHTFAPGTPTVRLTVTDAGGLTATTSQVVTVTVPTPEPPAPVAIAADAFERTTTGGFGTADTGGLWSRAGGAANFSTAAGQARMTVAAGASLRAALASSATSSDTVVDVVLDRLPAGGGATFGVIARGDVDNGYRAGLVVSAAGATSLRVTRVVNGVDTTVASTAVPGLSTAAGTVYHLRVQVTGASPTVVQVKVWADGTPEPAAWGLSGTDATASLQQAGGVGLFAYLNPAVTNGPLVVRWDALVSSKPV